MSAESDSMPSRKKPAPRKSAVTALLPVTIRPGNIRYAPGVRAGRWVFATGHKGTADFVSGMAPEVVDLTAPRHGLPKFKKEAQRIFANFAKVLEAGGTDRNHVVRLDQYYSGARVVDVSSAIIGATPFRSNFSITNHDVAVASEYS